VRENVRNALNKDYRSFETLKDALFYISTRLDIRIDTWTKYSEVLKDSLYQTRLDDFGG